jgi:cardiolipin synthase A/B
MRTSTLATALWLTTSLLGCAAPPAMDDDGTVGADDDGKEDSATSCNPDSARSVTVALSVTPDAGETPVVDVVNEARSSIRVMVYILDAGAIEDALVAKAQAGISVRAILDHTEQPTNQAAFDRLTAAGAKVEWSDPQFSYMHAKFLVVDSKDALIATGNFSEKLLSRERNYLAHDSDAKDVKTLVTLFDADFARKTPSLGCTRLLVSPINSKARLLPLILGAKKSVYIESMQFADADIRAAVAKVSADVDVRVLLAAPSWISTNTDAANFLDDAGIEVRYLTTPMVHVKSIIVDGKRAYLGSENLSTTSLTMNREVGMILESQSAALALMTNTFDGDWAQATAF